MIGHSAISSSRIQVVQLRSTTVGISSSTGTATPLCFLTTSQFHARSSLIRHNRYIVYIHAWSVRPASPYSSICTPIYYEIAVARIELSKTYGQLFTAAHPCKVALEGSCGKDLQCFQFGESHTTSSRSGCSGCLQVCRTSCELSGSSQRYAVLDGDGRGGRAGGPECTTWRSEKVSDKLDGRELSGTGGGCAVAVTATN